MSKKQSLSLDVSVFNEVVSSGTVEQRTALAGQLVELLRDPETPKQEISAIVPVLVSLAVDPVVSIRKYLTAQLVKLRRLPADIIFAVVADLDEIALDFLRKTPALDRASMLAILRAGDFARQQVIAMRGDVCIESVTEISERGSAELAACLLDNACAPVSSAHCRRLYVRFADEPAVVDRLLERRDLPWLRPG